MPYFFSYREEMVVMYEKQFITRREGVELAKTRGIPLSIGRVNKDSMDGISGRYGPTFLYTPQEFLRYATDRVLKNAPEAAA
jgi:hypothetical protein